MCWQSSVIFHVGGPAAASQRHFLPAKLSFYHNWNYIQNVQSIMAFNLQRPFEVCRNVENAVEFCVFHKNAKNCWLWAEEKVIWQKRSRNKNLPYCLKCSKCHKEATITLNTWFQDSKLTILQKLVYSGTRDWSRCLRMRRECQRCYTLFSVLQWSVLHSDY